MKVLKFGGTSVGTSERMMQVLDILSREESKIVVLSAMSGTTNDLVDIVNSLYKNEKDVAVSKIKLLKEKYRDVIKSLYESNESIEKGYALIELHFDFILSFTLDVFTPKEERSILAQGELLSTSLFYYLALEKGVKSELIPALDFMRTDKDGEPDQFYIKENLSRILKDIDEDTLVITQGYICRNVYGEVDNLKRGGSDYSASLIGAGIDAEEIQIWTDIDGMHNNDPRIVDDTKPISYLSYSEAAELAYFGAKILHPSSVLPAQQANVSVKLKNTMEPEAEGTLISSKSSDREITAIAAKDGITAIKIYSGRMLLAHGFLRKVFEVFEVYKTPIDMITTSEVSVSLTIDDDTYLDQIVEDLSKYGRIEIDKEQSIICIVGDFASESKGYANKIFNTLADIPVRMISYGGSKYNVSMLVQSSDKKRALVALNSLFYEF